MLRNFLIIVISVLVSTVVVWFAVQNNVLGLADYYKPCEAYKNENLALEKRVQYLNSLLNEGKEKTKEFIREADRTRERFREERTRWQADINTHRLRFQASQCRVRCVADSWITKKEIPKDIGESRRIVDLNRYNDCCRNCEKIEREAK